MQKGKLSQASKRDQQGVGDTPAGHINFCTNHDPPRRKLANLADVPCEPSII